jgi:hypothetical protein
MKHGNCVLNKRGESVIKGTVYGLVINTDALYVWTALPSHLLLEFGF